MNLKMLLIIAFSSMSLFSNDISVSDFYKFIENSKFKNCTVVKSEDSPSPTIKYIKDGKEFSRQIHFGHMDYSNKFSKHLFTGKHQVSGYSWVGVITTKYAMKIDGEVINLPTGHAGAMQKHATLKSLKLSSSSNSLFGLIGSVIYGNTILNCRK